MGPQLSTGSCRHRWLAGPAPLPPGRQAAVPQPGLLKPNPSFQLQLKRAPGQPSPGTLQPADLTVREFSLHSVPSQQSLQNKGQRDRDPSLPIPHQGQERPSPQRLLPGSGGRVHPEDKDHPSWEACASGSTPWGSQDQTDLQQSSFPPALPPQGGK